MAKVLLEDIVGKDPVLRSAGIEVKSAGTVGSGSPATTEAVEVLSDYGLHLSNHRSKPLSSELVDWADLVLVMETGHRQIVASLFSGAAGKTHLLSEYVGEHGDVPDPYSRGIKAYKECAAMLQELLKKVAKKLKD